MTMCGATKCSEGHGVHLVRFFIHWKEDWFNGTQLYKDNALRKHTDCEKLKKKW